MVRILLVLFVLFPHGCSLFNEEVSSSDAFRITNHSNEAILPLVIELENSYLVDLHPPSTAYFDQYKLERGHSLVVEEVSNYTRGDDIVLVIWRKKMRLAGEQSFYPNQREVTVAEYQTFNAPMLRQLKYHIVVE